MRILLNLRTLCILLSFFVAIMLVAPGFSVSQEPQSEEAKQTMALVDQAAALLESKGTDAFAKFRKKDSPWFKGHTYIFVLDMKGVDVFHPVHPDLEGKSIINIKDANGKAFIQEMIEIAKTKGSGWEEYMWPKPGETEPSKKMTYIKKVTTGNDTFIVCAGYYTN
jgi:cytochrome c